MAPSTAVVPDDVLPPEIADPAYVAWVEAVRAKQAEGRSIVLGLYDLIRQGEERDLWELGPWKSFEECISQEYGIHPQRYRHLHNAIDRFGREWIATNSFEAALCVLRTRQGSPAEKTVLAEIDQLAKKHGRAPSVEAVDRVVRSYTRDARPVRSELTEAERLRERVYELEKELRTMTARAHKAERMLAKHEAGAEKAKARAAKKMATKTPKKKRSRR